MGYDVQIKTLQQTVKRLTAMVVILFLAMAALLLTAFKTATPDVFRTRGLIIEDAQGRPRILLGAPAPTVPERVRTNHDLAVKEWGAGFRRTLPEMKWYKELNHDVVGMVLLDERGIDRVTVGAPGADPNIGRRREPGFGFHFNDKRGFERGGLSYADQAKLSSLGLDNNRGEGTVLFSDEAGTSGMLVNDPGKARRLFVGAAEPASDEGLPGRDHLGMWVRKRDGSGASFGFGGKEPVEKIDPHKPDQGPGRK